MAVDCLAGYLYQLQKNGDNVPSPSSVDGIDIAQIAEKLEASVDVALVNIITVDVAEYAKVHFEKSVRKVLTIPAQLNKAALEENI